MFKIIFSILFLLIIPFQFSLAQETKIYVARIDSEIKSGTVEYLERVFRNAQQNNAQYIVIELDTPGGLVDSTRKIIDLISASEIEVIVYVYKQNGWAYSAGSFILLSADYAFMHPEALTGAAEPRSMIGENEDNEKIKMAMASWIKSIAESKGRNSEMAEKIVTENRTFNGKEAKKAELIDNTASSLNELLKIMDLTENIIIERIEPNFFEKFFNFLSHPYLISLFLSFGLLGLGFAFRTGEFEFAGILGIIFLLIGLWGIGIIEFGILGIIFIVLGVILMLVELFVEPGFGVVGILGIISLAIGIFTFGSEPLLFPRLFDFATLFTLGSLFSFIFLFFVIGKKTITIFKSVPVTGSESIIGKKGLIDLYGRVKIDNESWSFKTINNTTIEKGEQVEIIGVEGNKLIVKKVEN